MLLWTWVCRYLFRSLLSFLWAMCSEVESQKLNFYTWCWLNIPNPAFVNFNFWAQVKDLPTELTCLQIILIMSTHWDNYAYLSLIIVQHNTDHLCHPPVQSLFLIKHGYYSTGYVNSQELWWINQRQPCSHSLNILFPMPIPPLWISALFWVFFHIEGSPWYPGIRVRQRFTLFGNI